MMLAIVMRIVSPKVMIKSPKSRTMGSLIPKDWRAFSIIPWRITRLSAESET